MNREKRKIPKLNTSALPDLIFTVLFFFMIVTHIRDNNTSMQIKIPDGDKLQKLQKRYAVSNLFIGKDKQNNIQIQLNEKVISLEQLTQIIAAEKDKITDDEQARYTICIKADKETPLHIISKVKESLQRANVRNVTFIATPSSMQDKNTNK